MNVLMSDADYAPWLMDALKLIEELQRQLADKTAEMESMCESPPEVERWPI